MLSYQGVTSDRTEGLGVALLEEMIHWKWVLRFQKPMPYPALSQLEDQDVVPYIFSSTTPACKDATTFLLRC